jgi:hypothetical protein
MTKKETAMEKPEHSAQDIIDRIVEEKTGLSAEVIRNMGIDEWRAFVEKRTGKPFTLHKEFPTIGRGNVLRDSLLTREEINTELDKVLK